MSYTLNNSCIEYNHTYRIYFTIIKLAVIRSQIKIEVRNMKNFDRFLFDLQVIELEAVILTFLCNSSHHKQDFFILYCWEKAPRPIAKLRAKE